VRRRGSLQLVSEELEALSILVGEDHVVHQQTVPERIEPDRRLAPAGAGTSALGGVEPVGFLHPLRGHVVDPLLR
jgi:hypothetical protein